jgi:hypothetical protein
MTQSPRLSVSLSRIPSLARVPSLGRVPSLQRVPSYEALPSPATPRDIELDHISIDSEPTTLNVNTEIQIAYEEQRQNYEVEHEEDHKVCIFRKTNGMFTNLC